MKKRGRKSKILVFVMSLIMILTCTNTSLFAFAEEADENVAWIGETGYATLEAAVNAAESGDTITLGEGKYTLYGKKADTKGKDLTFVGQGADKTAWGIGATIPDPDKFGTEYNGDYSFDGSGTITFKNMTLQSGTVDYLGFIRADNTVTDNCVINGKTFYWGYTSATFKDTTFNAPEGDYAIWTYSSPTMTFDGCTFNVSGKAINVYTDFSAGKYDITVNYNDCIVNGNTPEGKKDKAVMNINDSNMGDYKYIINISGNNTVNGVTPDDLNKEYTKVQKDITCSRLFEFNTKYGAGNSGRTVVSIDGIKVWENGNMIAHEIDTANDKYTDGYKDNAYEVTVGDWEETDTGSYIRKVKKVCQYCGRTIEEEQYASTLEVKTSLERENRDAYIAKDATFYVALFSDPDRQNRVTEPKKLNFVNDSKATATFDKLPVGETYYVGETNEDGELIGEDDKSGTVVMEIDGKKFTVEIGTSKYSDKEFDAKVVIESGGSEKSFKNVLWETPIGFFKQFTITKKVVDVEGNPMKYTGSFYVTLFKDEACTEPATMDGNPIMITLNDESEETVVVETPDFGLYYLAETDANGKKVDDSFKFVPTFSSTTAKITADADVSIELTNQAKADEPGASTEDPNKGNDDSGDTINDSDVQTGDSTNIMLLLAMMITSIMLGGIIFLRTRRKKVE